MDKLFRMVLAGVLAGFILFLVMGISYNFTQEVSDPSIRHLFRENISMKWFYKLLFINIGTGIIMALFYSIMQNGLPGSGIIKGIFWGFTVWAIMVCQPLITLLVTGRLTTALLVSWLAQGFASYVAAGISIAMVEKS